MTWSSSDPDAAEVDRDTGLVTAGREPGRTKITARSQSGLTDSCEAAVRGIVLPENLIMRENENQRLIPEVYGAALEREDAAKEELTAEGVTFVDVDNAAFTEHFSGYAEANFPDLADWCNQIRALAPNA